MTLINDVVKVVPMLLLSVVAVGIALLFQALADATEVHGASLSPNSPIPVDMRWDLDAGTLPDRRRSGSLRLGGRGTSAGPFVPGSVERG